MGLHGTATAKLGKATGWPRILVVGENPDVTGLLCRSLAFEPFQCTGVVGARQALDAVASSEVDAALVAVPGESPEDGLRIARSLREAAEDVGVVLVCQSRGLEDLVAALRLGVVDYLSEPLSATELADAVKRAVEWGAAVRSSRRPPAEHQEEWAGLTEAFGRKLVEAQVTSSLTLDACVTQLYGDDPVTLGHVRRVASVSQMLCSALKIGEPLLGHIWRAALVKDLGALAIPDATSTRAGLVFDEATTIRLQLRFAVDALMRLPYLRPAADIVSATREHYDGSGAPNGLAGNAIPIGGRVIAVATTFDRAGVEAATTPSESLDRANAELVRHAGTRLDPQVVTAWLEYVDRPGTDSCS